MLCFLRFALPFLLTWNKRVALHIEFNHALRAPSNQAPCAPVWIQSCASRFHVLTSTKRLALQFECNHALRAFILSALRSILNFKHALRAFINQFASRCHVITSTKSIALQFEFNHALRAFILSASGGRCFFQCYSQNLKGCFKSSFFFVLKLEQEFVVLVLASE